MTGSEPETDSWQRNYRGALSDAFLDHDATEAIIRSAASGKVEHVQ